jgi:hypothetical protein
MFPQPEAWSTRCRLHTRPSTSVVQSIQFRGRSAVLIDTNSNGRPTDRSKTRCSRLNKQRPYVQENHDLWLLFIARPFIGLFFLVFSVNVDLFSGLCCRRFGDLNCFFLQRISIKLVLCFVRIRFWPSAPCKSNSCRANLYKFCENWLFVPLNSHYTFYKKKHVGLFKGKTKE